MIEVSHLVKEFKIPVQKKGRFAAVRNLFSSEHTIKRAVDDITFSVDDGNSGFYREKWRWKIHHD